MITIDLNELNLKPHDVVLDAGCGLGRHLRHLARMPELKIFGIDKNTWALTETAKSMAQQCPTRSRKIICFPLPISQSCLLPILRLIA